MRFVTGIAICSVLVSSAFGQIDATTLRAKYGEPINYGKRVNSETFKVRDNIEIVVYYGPGKRVQSSGQVAKFKFALLSGSSRKR